MTELDGKLALELCLNITRSCLLGLLGDSLEKGTGGLYTEMFLNFLGAGLGVSRTQQEVFAGSPKKVLEKSAGESAELANKYSPLFEVH